MPSRACALLIVVVAWLAAAPSARAQDRGGYIIRAFDTVLTVEANSDLVVDERIEVVFSEPRHGIYRTIPVRYSDPRGFAYSLGLRLAGVTDDEGRRQTTDVSHEGRYVKIRIGDPDRTVAGAVVYVIRYRVRDALGAFAEHDEIYWNATGHEWNAPIERSTVTVRLPAEVPADVVRAAGYTGAFGSRDDDVAIAYPSPGVIRFETGRSLGPLEGLTVAVGFPQGLVTFPSVWTRAGRLAADNWIVLAPFGWLVVLWERYRRRGRDPEGDAPVTVAYEPPPGLSPGVIGTLVDERVDLVDMTATVVDLAVRRYLTIRTEERTRLLGLLSQDETIFVRESDAGGQGVLQPHEQALLRALFARGNEVTASDLKNRFYQHLPGLRREFDARLVEKGLVDASPSAVRGRWMGLGYVAGVATGLVGLAWMGYRDVPPPAFPLVPIVAGALSLIVFLAFARAMPRRTKKGVDARRWAIGFQEYVRRVEGDRLERAVRDPRGTFEALLPYAMALGVADAWAKQFDGIYTSQGPVWYSSTHTGAHAFSTSSFERSLSSAMSSTGQHMASSPRSSSGSGGGGSSGGGGGGGGGGSW
ncbi:MAG: hypothetical protein ABS36_19040 [Acidobacteria bacterium SCN 69-37]|nr:MAG: hypothetical protein ABS36_19040 [Acidobacteria bacterium SCN 69-37]